MMAQNLEFVLGRIFFWTAAAESAKDSNGRKGKDCSEDANGHAEAVAGIIQSQHQILK